MVICQFSEVSKKTSKIKAKICSSLIKLTSSLVLNKGDDLSPKGRISDETAMGLIHR